MKYRAFYRRDADGLWRVDVPNVGGCSTHASTLEEARTRIRRLLNMFFPNHHRIEVEDDYGDSLTTIPRGATVCPACNRSDVVTEKRVLGRVVKSCPDCGLRWSDNADESDGG